MGEQVPTANQVPTGATAPGQQVPATATTLRGGRWHLTVALAPRRGAGR